MSLGKGTGISIGIGIRIRSQGRTSSSFTCHRKTQALDLSSLKAEELGDRGGQQVINADGYSDHVDHQFLGHYMVS